MATRKFGALDAMVGAKIRVLRVSRGISETALAARIGVTCQQVQKYERGAGRVGASRLARIAAVLDVSVGEFFESSRAGIPDSKSPVHPLAKRGSWRLLDASAQLPRLRLRAYIAKLFEIVADRSRRGGAATARLDAVDLGERRKWPSRG
jgi:transcriptional regulator with XRE-family HTH domain